jgi:hypothetical protein
MDYKNGKIYKITDIAYTKMYIGSTCQPLSKRFTNHKKDYKLWKNGKRGKFTSFDLFDEFGIENCKIELIENYECNCKDELLKKEGEHIKNNDCVNKFIPCRTPKEYREANKDKLKEYNKEYQQANKDKILEYQKEYYVDNKDKIKEYNNEYKQANKEKIKEYNKEYQQANKEKKAEYNKKYYTKKKLAKAQL